MLNNLRPFIKGGFIAGLLDYLKLGACVCYMLYNHFIFLWRGHLENSLLKTGWWMDNRLQRILMNILTFHLLNRLLLQNLNTHRISRATELPEGLWCVCAMNLQGHAGSRAQLGHHVLREPSGIKTHLVLLFWSDTVYLYYYIIFINIRLPAKFRKYVSIIWFQILVALILLVLAAVGEYYQVSKNTPVSARLRIVSFLLPHMHHKADTKDVSLT